jgi:hypothetical protein
MFDDGSNSDGAIEWGVIAKRHGCRIAYCEVCYVKQPTMRISECIHNCRLVQMAGINRL